MPSFTTVCTWLGCPEARERWEERWSRVLVPALPVTCRVASRHWFPPVRLGLGRVVCGGGLCRHGRGSAPSNALGIKTPLKSRLAGLLLLLHTNGLSLPPGSFFGSLHSFVFSLTRRSLPDPQTHLQPPRRDVCTGKLPRPLRRMHPHLPDSRPHPRPCHLTESQALSPSHARRLADP